MVLALGPMLHRLASNMINTFCCHHLTLARVVGWVPQYVLSTFGTLLVDVGQTTAHEVRQDDDCQNK